MTFPSGVVISLLWAAGAVSAVEMKDSEREDEVGIMANRSVIQTVLTLQQGSFKTSPSFILGNNLTLC